MLLFRGRALYAPHLPIGFQFAFYSFISILLLYHAAGKMANQTAAIDNPAIDNPSVMASPCHLPLHKGGYTQQSRDLKTSPALRATSAIP
jgi:hypothetical protein